MKFSSNEIETDFDKDIVKSAQPDVLFTLNEPCDTENYPNNELFAYENNVIENNHVENMINKLVQGIYPKFNTSSKNEYIADDYQK